jgi:hypothetical protein
MAYLLNSTRISLLVFAVSRVFGFSFQAPPAELKNKIDALVAPAYQAVASAFPCKLKTGGKPMMAQWQDVDRCLNGAAERLDWPALAGELEKIRAGTPGLTASEFWIAVDSSISAHALPYEKVFAVKDPKTLLPLTNSLLKYLPADSLQGLDVVNKAGTRVGSFQGTYSYERSGGLATANSYQLIVFQYADPGGNIQAASEKLLLDSYGVPWKDARSQLGFRLPSDKLTARE